MTLIDLQGHFGYFCLKLLSPLVESPGDLTTDDIADDLQ